MKNLRGRVNRNVLKLIGFIFYFGTLTTVVPTAESAQGPNLIERRGDGPAILPGMLPRLNPNRWATVLKKLHLDESIHRLELRAVGSASAVFAAERYQHRYHGLEVIGSEVFLIESSSRDTERDRIAVFDLDTTPRLSMEDAVLNAQSYLLSRPGAISPDKEMDVRLNKLPILKILPAHRDHSAQLVYWIETTSETISGRVREFDLSGMPGEFADEFADEFAEEFDGISGISDGQTILINAHNGQIVASLPKYLTIAPIQVYSAKNQGVEVIPQGLGCVVTDLKTGKRQRVDMLTCRNLGRSQCQVVVNSMPVMTSLRHCTKTVLNSVASPTADVSSRRAAANTATVLNYYSTHHRRNSFDDRGTEVLNLVHGGILFSNAYWSVDEKRMVYGDGDGRRTGDFTLALDVAAHEWTHGVTSSTANLIYMGESGALNEAYSDFFGKIIENKGDWVLGRSLFLDPTAKGMRDLAQPGSILSGLSQPYPSTVREMVPIRQPCDNSNDQCWVHVNSTVPSHASYLIFKSIGQQKAETLIYQTLTQALGANEDFESAAQATLQVCGHLFDSGTCTKVRQAFADVGL